MPLFPTITRRAKWTFIGRKRSGIGANFGNDWTTVGQHRLEVGRRDFTIKDGCASPQALCDSV